VVVVPVRLWCSFGGRGIGVALWLYWQWGCGGSVVVVAVRVWWKCCHNGSWGVVAVWL
jgi:hypothetical protein